MQKHHFPAHLWKYDQPFRFQSGETIPGFEIAYESRGALNDARDNVVIVLHALSGSSHAFSSELNSEPGWWELLIEDGSPIDVALVEPEDVSIIVYDALGRIVTRIHEGELAGSRIHQFIWASGSHASGTYHIRIIGQSFAEVRSVTLLK